VLAAGCRFCFHIERDSVLMKEAAAFLDSVWVLTNVYGVVVHKGLTLFKCWTILFLLLFSFTLLFIISVAYFFVVSLPFKAALSFPFAHYLYFIPSFAEFISAHFLFLLFFVAFHPFHIFFFFPLLCFILGPNSSVGIATS
jgi:hypothetical protein